MVILGIDGSHRDGNTRIMLEAALEQCKKKGLETKLITLSDKDIRYCTVCDACKTGFKCSQDDDAFKIIQEMREADAIIFGSPTYFGSISGRLKTLFDRTLPLRRNGFLLAGKVGGALSVGGSRNGGQEKAISAIHDLMFIHEMIVVSDKETAHFGGIGWARNLREVLGDDIGMQTSRNLGLKVSEVVSSLRE